VAYFLKARIVEPEKQPSLDNNCVSTQHYRSHCYTICAHNNGGTVENNVFYAVCPEAT
jgi:hypothetical protein